MSVGIQIDVLGIECNTDTPDADGVLWDCGPIDGWASADTRGGALSPTGRHGLARLNQLHGGRPLRAFGTTKAPSQAAAWDAYYRLAAILDLNAESDVIVYEPVPKFVTASLAPGNPPKMEDPVDGFFQWDLALVAAFPFKRAVTGTTTAIGSGGSATLVNGGRIAAYPTATVASGGTVDLTIGTRHFTTTDLPVGAVVDMWARTITAADGSSLYGTKSAASKWLALPPGSSLGGQGGMAGLDLTWHDTYA